MKKVATPEPSQQQKPDNTIEVAGIPDNLLKLLDERVRQAGVDRTEYILKLIQKDLLEMSPRSHDDAPHADMTFEELLLPVHQQVKESGVTGEELDDLFEELREEVYITILSKL